MRINPVKKQFDAYSTKKILFMPMGAMLGKTEVRREIVEPRTIDLRVGAASKMMIKNNIKT